MPLPNGFRYAGVSCGIKENSTQDLALIVADNECVAAGVYTQNLVRAACIEFNQSITPTENCRAVVVNSGNANACTGETGRTNCVTTAQCVASAIGCKFDNVLVLSTGVIGHPLPIDKVASGISAAADELATGETAFMSTADAFLTTDQFRKIHSLEFDLSSGKYRIAGIAKGAGMIGPNMATMLAVFVTDAPINALQAQTILKTATDHSFNKISVDGHTSTNDAVLLMASGAGGGLSNIDLPIFESNLIEISVELAKMIPRDGEGASKLIEVNVGGCLNDFDAERIARVIASSNLVKTAVYGNDPNWGRIVSAAGYSGVDLAPEQISLWINEIDVYRNGSPLDFDEKKVSQLMSDLETTQIRLSVGDGNGRAVHWTSDLTKAYVELNSEYRT